MKKNRSRATDLSPYNLTMIRLMWLPFVLLASSAPAQIRKAPTGPIVRVPDFTIVQPDPALFVLDRYVFQDGASSAVYTLASFGAFDWGSVTREPSYGLQGLAFDGKHTVYGVNWVGDSRDPYLFTPSAHAVDDGTKWTGPLRRPTGVAVDKAGRIYISDATLCQVVRVDDVYGNGMVTFGSEGSAIGQFMHPGGIAVGPTGQIYVADTGNRRIVRIDDMNGEGWRTYDGAAYGSVGKQVTTVTDIAVDARNRLYYCREDNGYVVRVDDMDGRNMAWYGGPALGVGSYLVHPSGIALDRAGRAYVSDAGAGWVVRIDDFDAKNVTTLFPPSEYGRPFRPSKIAVYYPSARPVIR